MELYAIIPTEGWPKFVWGFLKVHILFRIPSHFRRLLIKMLLWKFQRDWISLSDLPRPSKYL